MAVLPQCKTNARFTPEIGGWCLSSVLLQCKTMRGSHQHSLPQSCQTNTGFLHQTKRWMVRFTLPVSPLNQTPAKVSDLWSSGQNRVYHTSIPVGALREREKHPAQSVRGHCPCRGAGIFALDSKIRNRWGTFLRSGTCAMAHYRLCILSLTLIFPHPHPFPPFMDRNRPARTVTSQE